MLGKNTFVDYTLSLYMPCPILSLLAVAQARLSFLARREKRLLSMRLVAFTVRVVYLFVAAPVEELALGGRWGKVLSTMLLAWQRFF